MIDWKKYPDAVQVAVNYLDANGDTINIDVFAPPSQTKTVADAVADHGGKWPFSHGIILMGYSPKHEHYFAFGDGYELAGGEYMVCTHKQFEAYVKEQEGEKWTHVDEYQNPCLVVIGKPDVDGNVVILRKDGLYDCIHSSSVWLKPIKPTISQDQAKAVMEFATEHGLISEGQIWTSMERDII